MHSQGVTEKRIARRWRDREGKCNRRLTSVANALLEFLERNKKRGKCMMREMRLKQNRQLMSAGFNYGFEALSF